MQKDFVGLVMEKLVDEETITPDELEIDEKGQKYSKKGMPM